MRPYCFYAGLHPFQCSCCGATCHCGEGVRVCVCVCVRVHVGDTPLEAVCTIMYMIGYETDHVTMLSNS